MNQNLSAQFTQMCTQSCRRLALMSIPTMCFVMTLMVSVSSTLVFAQDELRPPKTSESPSAPKYIILFIAVLLVAGVVFASTFRSKRSHQD
ncbi:MAG: hypothetical protein P1U42_06075 [Phycisphaerales bacterium]|nr:hypothetical protein [Phycisphaerales bacterium]